MIKEIVESPLLVVISPQMPVDLAHELQGQLKKVNSEVEIISLILKVLISLV